MKRRLTFVFIILAALVAGVFADEADKISDYKLGMVSREQVLKDSTDWAQMLDEYRPDPEEVNYLASVLALVKIEVYFGHWCHDSVNNVPKFIKVIDQAGSDSYDVKYWSVAKRKKGMKRNPVNNRNLKAIPTFVVFLNGREVGEIVENPRISIEADLADILRKVYKEE